MNPPSPSASDHRLQAAAQGPVPVAIITVSDSRRPETDVNASYLRGAIADAGHRVVSYHLIKDDPQLVAETLEQIAAGEARVLLFNGGTGISRRDNTYDVVSRRLEKTLPGFGEIFRFLSYQEIGAAAMLSRAAAGVYRGKVVFAMPGSPHAVRLAWEKLIAPELSHLAWEVIR